MLELRRRTECVIGIVRKERSSKIAASPSDKLIKKITRGSDSRPRSRSNTHALCFKAGILEETRPSPCVTDHWQRAGQNAGSATPLTPPTVTSHMRTSLKRLEDDGRKTGKGWLRCLESGDSKSYSSYRARVKCKKWLRGCLGTEAWLHQASSALSVDASYQSQSNAYRTTPQP